MRHPITARQLLTRTSSSTTMTMCRSLRRTSRFHTNIRSNPSSIRRITCSSSSKLTSSISKLRATMLISHHQETAQSAMLFSIMETKRIRRTRRSNRKTDSLLLVKAPCLLSATITTARALLSRSMCSSRSSSLSLLAPSV